MSQDLKRKIEAEKRDLKAEDRKMAEFRRSDVARTGKGVQQEVSAKKARAEGRRNAVDAMKAEKAD